ncbi:MAG: DUF2182 domain-containing protein [Alphaproteobacteria bacterium]|nr:DUF2182 domain-containing protein [Alphaproteobacteria bacterium]
MIAGMQPWRVALAIACLAAWVALMLSADGLTLATVCSSGSGRVASTLSILDSVPLEDTLSEIVLRAVLMTAAMMLPLVAAPLKHVRARSFAQRRPRASLLFLVGYAVVWICAGIILHAIAIATRWATPPWLASESAVIAVAVLWQVSPPKQWCLNRCHRRPHLAAFGLAADRDALAFGLGNGLFCVGTCWALMLVPLSTARWHLIAMAAASLFIFAERLERPAALAWRCRFPCKAARIATAQLRHLAQAR